MRRKISEEIYQHSRDLNPGQLGEKREHYLYAMPPSHVSTFVLRFDSWSNLSFREVFKELLVSALWHLDDLQSRVNSG